MARFRISSTPFADEIAPILASYLQSYTRTQNAHVPKLCTLCVCLWNKGEAHLLLLGVARGTGPGVKHARVMAKALFCVVGIRVSANEHVHAAECEGEHA